MCCEEESTADSETPNLRGRFLLSINDETELFDSFFKPSLRKVRANQTLIILNIHKQVCVREQECG